MKWTLSEMGARHADAQHGFELIGSFVKFIASLPEADPFFRGHANQAWRAVPSALRPDMYGIKSAANLDRWKAAAARFVDRDHSDLEWLVLAQHYGVPTILLDWTTNPLIALFFACQRSYHDNQLSDGQVLVAYPSAFLSDPSYERRTLFEAWEGPPMLFAANTMNKRSLAQNSVVSLHCEGNAEIHFEGADSIFLVPANAKESVLYGLETLGVGVGTVFADINSAARVLAETLGREHFVHLLAKGPYS